MITPNPAPGPASGHGTPAAVPAGHLVAQAAGLGAGLPALLADAEHLADTIVMGGHGRRRAGLGDAFWQYRPAQPGDPARSIDWRRSARADQTYVREREAEIAQSVMIWADASRAMDYCGDVRHRPTKASRARLLALAAGLLMLRGGERVGLMAQRTDLVAGSAAGGDTGGGVAAAPRTGRAHRLVLADRLLAPSPADYGAPDPTGLPVRGVALMLSDCLGDPTAIEATLTAAATRGVRGALVQILDPTEEDFTFDGRTIFESMGGGLRHETRRAGDLRARYRDRLASRKDRMAQAAAKAGWLWHCHHTDRPAQPTLMWIWRALERGR